MPLKRLTQLGVPVGIVMIVVMLVVPLPAMVLDLLIATNITGALLVLMVTMFVHRPLDFAAFPAVILVMTLFRLALNVSATRLVLLDGYAGKVIDTFGHFVVGGSLLVGLIAIFQVATQLAPELVAPLKDAGPGTARVSRLRGVREGWAWAPRRWTQVTADTGIGNPSKSTAAKGEAYVGAAVERIAGFLVELAALDLKKRSRLNSARIRLRHLSIHSHRHMQRIDGTRLIDVEKRVIAPRNDRRDVVAPSLVIGVVHYPDRAMPDGFIEAANTAVIGTVEDQQSVSDGGVVHEMLEAVVARRRNMKPFHRCTPLLGGDHRSSVRSESDQHDTIAVVCLAHELTDVHHSRARHVGEASVADVGIVFPDDGLRVPAVVCHESLERLDHVMVANVPARGSAAHHRSVVQLGVSSN